MIPEKYRLTLTKLFSRKIILFATFGLLIVALLTLQVHRFLSKPTISKIKRGDIVSYSRNNKNYTSRVLGLPGESILFKGIFYVKSKDKFFSVDENNLPDHRYLLNTDNLEANSQKWFTVGKNEIYLIKDEYPQQPEWSGDSNSKIITIRTLDISGGLVKVEEVMSIKYQSGNNNLALKNYQSVTDSPDKIPKVDLLYPSKIVNRNKITAIIKINLIDRALINSEFLKIDPYSKFFGQENQTDKNNYIYFNPSRTTSEIEITLNGIALVSHGFTTKPYIKCSKHIDTLERTGDNYYESEKECLEKSQVDLLVFANLILNQGSNQLEITRKDINTSMKYEILFNSQYSESSSLLPVSADVPIEKRFSITHNCSTLSLGKVISIPMVKSADSNFYYRLSFPQNRGERGNASQRLVYFGIEGVLYEITLSSISEFNKIISTSGDLDIPLDYLVFKNWAKAKPSQMLKTDNLPFASFYYPGIYFELIPFDRSSKVYPSYVLPWGTVNSSGCDG
ncbi:MAG: hypothetical protein Q7R95_00145 [bacterium]|nr:hypothetical protein [bacterium]